MSKAGERWLTVTVGLMVLVVAGPIMAGVAAIRALIVGDPIDVRTALFGGFFYVVVLLVGGAVQLIYDRFGDSAPEGELPEPKEGISRWTPR